MIEFVAELPKQELFSSEEFEPGETYLDDQFKIVVIGVHKMYPNKDYHDTKLITGVNITNGKYVISSNVKRYKKVTLSCLMR